MKKLAAIGSMLTGIFGVSSKPESSPKKETVKEAKENLNLAEHQQWKNYKEDDLRRDVGHFLEFYDESDLVIAIDTEKWQYSIKKKSFGEHSQKISFAKNMKSTFIDFNEMIDRINKWQKIFNPKSSKKNTLFTFITVYHIQSKGYVWCDMYKSSYPDAFIEQNITFKNV